MIQFGQVIGNVGGSNMIEVCGVVIDGGDEIINDKGIDFCGRVDGGISSGDIVIAY